MNYLGLLEKLDLLSLSEKERTALYISKGIFVEENKISLQIGGLSEMALQNSTKVQVPSTNLVIAFHNFILANYANLSTDIFIDFFYGYNNQTFGLEPLEIKRIARDHYLSISNNILKTRLDLVRLENTPSGDHVVKNAEKLELFALHRDVLPRNLIKMFPEGLAHFLMGDTGYFNNALVDKAPILKEIVTFEGYLKVLLDLNKKFGFEKSSPLNVKNEDVPKNNPIRDDKEISKQKSNKVRRSVLSDEEAIHYLINNIFKKKK
ncbi:hypothetical protein [Maribacter luteus]|uniref:Uncharacterized protein n=1 Tax=Maribacter luteus TaxID=2594478 RepID=A0A6I2MJ84_9FLAO|nr:hypothetical protein [Maribacter luteus]MRX62579.1 hypothetical protein [Maribacter luteus]